MEREAGLEPATSSLEGKGAWKTRPAYSKRRSTLAWRTFCAFTSLSQPSFCVARWHAAYSAPECGRVAGLQQPLRDMTRIDACVETAAPASCSVHLPSPTDLSETHAVELALDGLPLSVVCPDVRIRATDTAQDRK